jgi:hypothetical protein
MDNFQIMAIEIFEIGNGNAGGGFVIHGNHLPSVCHARKYAHGREHE